MPSLIGAEGRRTAAGDRNSGGGLTLWAGRAAAAMLYGLKPYDPATLGGAIGLLAAVALVATYGPAHRASRIEPIDALREE